MGTRSGNDCQTQWLSLAVIAAVGLINVAASAQGGADSFPTNRPKPQGTILSLTKPFHTRSRWRLVVTEGSPVQDYGDNNAPGALTLCLHKGPRGPCISGPVTPTLKAPKPDYAPAWEPHYLLTDKVVYPRGPKAAPFLLIITGSLNSGDGGQLIYTQLIKYDADRDAFQRVFSKGTGHNNNEEIRLVEDGPLRGDFISAEPEDHSPFGYWIVVDQPTPTDAYRHVLRYRSATRYADGNPLAVIDSEMPNIDRRF